MSRHRYVRNLDLEAELDEDRSDDYEDDYYEGGDSDEPDDGMTAEERAQMNSAMPVVRAQLKGLKPPITDAEIQDSLWHYFFDVDKSVAWLKKDWEKKGDDARPPLDLVPTPQEQPRPRRIRRPKAEAALAKPPTAPQPATPIASTLTALQRLSLARKAASGSTPTSTSASTISLKESSVPKPPASPAPTPASNSSKPLSKLALLRQKRMEGTVSHAEAAPVPAISLALPTPLAPTGLGPSSPPAAPSPSPAKPLSKLAQKMAAARAAREAVTAGVASPSTPSTPAEPPVVPDPEPFDQLWSFAPASSSKPATTSVFFNILTTHTPETVLPEPPSLADMHIAVRNREVAAHKVREAFGPGVESPDDIVLRMRDGRAGTGGPTSAKDKAVATEVRAPKKGDAPPPPSEVKEVPATPAPAKSKRSEGKPQPSKPPAKGSSIPEKSGNAPPKGGNAPTRGGKTKHGGGAGTTAGRGNPPSSAEPGATTTKAPKTTRPPPKTTSGTAKTKLSGGPKGRSQAKARESAAAQAQRSKSLPAKQRVQTGSMSRTGSASPNSRGSASSTPVRKGSSTPRTPKTPQLTVAQQDMAGLHLGSEVDEEELARERAKYEETYVPHVKEEEIIAKVRKQEEEGGKKNMSLVVIGHVDAGKSTLMGRLLYDLGELSEREKEKNERGSKRVGKSSFAFAWGLDALGDERDRGVTIDIATTHFETPHRNVTLLDAPGHRDFIPAMISGAAQADVALLVIDGGPGGFESGFQRGGQTREHAWLVRSLGVKEIVVGINKMDMVDWSQDRYDDIVDGLKPFLASAGFAAAKTTFLPLAAMEGTNLVEANLPEEASWYKGTTLVDALDRVEVPERPYAAPLRVPLSNVFKGQTAIASGVAVQGRLASGVVQVGDAVRGMPGDVMATIRTIEVDDDTAPYAVAGQNVTLYLSGCDPNQLAIGSVLCPPSRPIRLVTKFVAQILVFDVSMPIITGTQVELFHHSVNVPAAITRLLAISERGVVVKQNPRVLQKGTTATVEITVRQTPGARSAAIPLETITDNKEMGRVLIRRGGETIAAGNVMELLA